MQLFMSLYIYEVYDKIVCICVCLMANVVCLRIQEKLNSREATP